MLPFTDCLDTEVLIPSKRAFKYLFACMEDFGSPLLALRKVKLTFYPPLLLSVQAAFSNRNIV